MDPFPSDFDSPATRTNPDPGEPGVAACVRMLSRAPDDRTLERMLVAWSVHRDGSAFDRAWLLAWDGPTGRLVVRHHAGRDPGPGAAADALRAALERGPWGESQEAPCVLDPEALDGVPGDTWRDGRPRVGEPGEADAPWRGHPAAGATMFLRDGKAAALLVGVWDHAAASETATGFLAALGEIAGPLFDAQARAAEARARARTAAALAEFARASVSSLNLSEALHLAARLACLGTGSLGSALWLARPDGDLRLEVTHGPAGRRERLARALEPFAAATLSGGRPWVADEHALDALGISGEPIATAAAWPLAAYGRTLGVLAVHDAAPGPEGPATAQAIEFLGTLADLTAGMLEAARREDALRASEHRRRDLADRMRREERLAALGELAAEVAHEARNPLASISAFARRVHRGLEEDDPQRDYLEIVLRETERLEGLIEGPLRYAELEPPRLELENVNALIQQVLQEMGESLVRRRVRLLKRLSPDLPPMLLDAARIRQVVRNILTHALESVPMGGRLRIESRRVQPYVVVDVAHDGAQAPGDLLERLFVPFAAGRVGTADVGLGTAQQVVREHGGEIRLRREPEWGTVYSFTLPILENQDRRAAASDRRGARPDRRRRSPNEPAKPVAPSDRDQLEG